MKNIEVLLSLLLVGAACYGLGYGICFMNIPDPPEKVIVERVVKYDTIRVTELPDLTMEEIELEYKKKTYENVHGFVSEEVEKIILGESYESITKENRS